jgi:hypothetical protein
MSETITFVTCGGDWRQMFVGDEMVLEGHSLRNHRIASELMDVDYDEIRRWDATASRSDTSFVEYNDQIALYLRENGVSFLFESDTDE